MYTDGGSEVTAASRVTRYRAGMASLLAKSVIMTHDLERQLDADEGGREETMRAEPDADPWPSYQISCALLLRKARLHTFAALGANKNNNLHSLAVQMRPVLECAGQVVFIFHNLVVAPKLATDPKRASNAIHDYWNADYYRTVISASKGESGHNELLREIWKLEDDAAVSVGAIPRPDAKKRKGRGLKQIDKVATLSGGSRWYNHLSEYFCHGRGDFRGALWQGGVVATPTVQGEFAFAGFMDYLAEQVAIMNVHAALCPGTGDDGQARLEATVEQLQKLREGSKALRDPVVSAFLQRRHRARTLVEEFAEHIDPRQVCEGQRDMLREVTRIHLEIDAPDRGLGADEPDWILRLRKVCFHSLAITMWEISVDIVHVMATELRAAYVQMDAIWKYVPEECRIDPMYDSWWADEARAGLLAKYDHPTPTGLLLPTANGGLGEAEHPASYISLALWLGRLGLGYGIALSQLAKILGRETDVDSRLEAAMRQWAIPTGTAWRRGGGES